MASLFVIYIPAEDIGFYSSDDFLNEDKSSMKKSSSSSKLSSLKKTVNDVVNGSRSKTGELNAQFKIENGQLTELNSKGLPGGGQANSKTVESHQNDGFDQSDEIRLERKVSFTTTPAIISNTLPPDKEARIRKAIECGEDIEIERVTLRQVLIEVLDELHIENDVWFKTDDEKFWQVSFVVEGTKCDPVLDKLIEGGFGRIAETSVSVYPASFFFTGLTSEENLSPLTEKLKEKSEFIKSIKSRLTVAQVVGAVKSNAELTFDFITLVLLASMIAALGLAESSSVTLVASMLVSPLMGPIIGGTFGLMVKNRELCKLGVRNELIGLSLCVSFGFLFGIITGLINNSGAKWGSTDSWPTPEMQARGMTRSLWVGVLIALPSGAGVALSVLGGNTGSLVGVAISASLLPPAVNAGNLWGLALVSAISPPPLDYIVAPQIGPGSLNCTRLLNNGYEFIYNCYLPREAATVGCFSLLLTIVNIMCIFVTGVAVLKLKEIAPHTAISPAAERFWKKDIPATRDIYKGMAGDEPLDVTNMARQIAAEYRNSRPEATEQEVRENIRSVIRDLEVDPTFNLVSKKVPGVAPSIRQTLAMDELEEFPPIETERKFSLQPEATERKASVEAAASPSRMTIGDPSTAESLLKQLTLNVDDRLDHRRGSVLKLRIGVQNPGDTHSAPGSRRVSNASEEEILMLDRQKLRSWRKLPRMYRAYRNVKLRRKDGDGQRRFPVSTIAEDDREKQNRASVTSDEGSVTPIPEIRIRKASDVQESKI